MPPESAPHRRHLARPADVGEAGERRSTSRDAEAVSKTLTSSPETGPTQWGSTDRQNTQSGLQLPMAGPILDTKLPYRTKIPDRKRRPASAPCRGPRLNIGTKRPFSGSPYGRFRALRPQYAPCHCHAGRTDRPRGYRQPGTHMNTAHAGKASPASRRRAHIACLTKWLPHLLNSMQGQAVDIRPRGWCRPRVPRVPPEAGRS